MRRFRITTWCAGLRRVREVTANSYDQVVSLWMAPLPASVIWSVEPIQ